MLSLRSQGQRPRAQREKSFPDIADETGRKPQKRGCFYQSHIGTSCPGVPRKKLDPTSGGFGSGAVFITKGFRAR